MSATNELWNPATGERIVFLRRTDETDGAYVEFDDYWTRPGHRVVGHIHPEMEERWSVVAGSPAFRIGEREWVAEPGEEVVAPMGTAHLGWNAGIEPVHLRVRLTPALGWEAFMRELFGLAVQGKVDANGMPSPADATSLLERYARELRPIR